MPVWPNARLRKRPFKNGHFFKKNVETGKIETNIFWKNDHNYKNDYTQTGIFQTFFDKKSKRAYEQYQNGHFFGFFEKTGIFKTGIFWKKLKTGIAKTGIFWKSHIETGIFQISKRGKKKPMAY